MHPFHVSLKLLRLAEFLSAEVAVGTIAAGIRRATVSSMHLKVVQSQEELKNNLTKCYTWSRCYKTFFGGDIDFPKFKT